MTATLQPEPTARAARRTSALARLSLAGLTLIAAACIAADPPGPGARPVAEAAVATPAVADPAVTAAMADERAATPRGTPPGCLPAGNNGYLRARLRGTMDLDLAWETPAMQCDGGARPDGRGLRVTLAGPAQANGRRLRFVFGIDEVPEGEPVLARPTNLTIIFEGEQRLFATRGNTRCTTDELRPERIGALGGARRTWRIVARGFCIDPATTLDGAERLLMTRFDFASEVSYEDEPAAVPAPARARAAAVDAGTGGTAPRAGERRP